MLEKQMRILEEMDAFVMYKFLILYNCFENKIKEIYSIEWMGLNEEVKRRVAYYVGSVKGINAYIEYDTYSTKQDIYRYDEDNLVSKMTINQIIRMERTEKNVSLFNFEIDSKLNKQLTFVSYDCILKIINMRNKLAHDILNVNFKSADIIEVLPNNIFEKKNEVWISNLQLDKLSDFGRGILSNYIFMSEILERFETERAII